MAITIGEVEVIVRARLDEFYEDIEKGAEDAGAETGTKFAAEFEQSVAAAGPITPEVALDVDTSGLEKGFEDIGKAADDASEGIEKGLENVDGAINESAEGMTSSIGGALDNISGKFEGLRSRMTKKIVMGLAIAGITMAIDEIQARWASLQDTFALVSQPPSINKDMAILNEAIAQQERAILKIPGALDELYKKRQELTELEITAENRARTTTGFLAAHVQREQEAAVDLTAAVDVWTSGMSGAVQPISDASSDIAGSIDEVSAASDRTRVEFEADFDAMLQTLIDQQDPVNQAAKAYASAVEDPIDISDRMAELKKEIERVAPDLKSEAPNVRAAAVLYTNAAREELELLEDQMFGYGSRSGDAWADGLLGAFHRRSGDINIALDEYRSVMAGQSPPKKGPLKDIDKGGFNVGKAWVDGLVGGLGMAGNRVSGTLDGLMPALFGNAHLNVGASPFAGADTGAAARGPVTVNVYNPDREPASQSVEERLRIAAATGIF